MIRVIADITWTAPDCGNAGCYYVVSSLISNASDPLLNTILPGPPTQSAPAPGNSQVTIDWSAPGSNGGSAITGYDVYVGTSSGGENYSTPACTAGPSVTSCAVTGLTNGTTYYFTVEAVNAAGNSVPSNQESAVPNHGSITLSTTIGPVGTVVTISGADFAPGGTINHSTGVTFGGSNVSIGGSNVSIASNGTWSATFTVPNVSGPQTVTATDSAGVSASANFTVTTITLSTTTGPVGTVVTMSGAGFTPGGTINHSTGVTFGGSNVSIGGSNVSIAPTSSPASGTWSATFTVPNASSGPQTVTATDSSGVSASASFTVSAIITLSPTSGPKMTVVTISGAGFTPGKTINRSTGVTFGGSNVRISSNVTITSNGTWSATFTVPNASNGPQTVTATDSLGVSASASFTVT